MRSIVFCKKIFWEKVLPEKNGNFSQINSYIQKKPWPDDKTHFVRSNIIRVLDVNTICNTMYLFISHSCSTKNLFLSYYSMKNLLFFWVSLWEFGFREFRIDLVCEMRCREMAFKVGMWNSKKNLCMKSGPYRKLKWHAILRLSFIRGLS